MTDILDRLQLLLSAERDAGDLITLDPTTIAAALERFDALGAQLKLGNHIVLHEYDAIADFLGTLISFRSRKMMACVGRGTPSNMMPVERQFFDEVSAAVLRLRDAWGVTE